MIEKHLLLARNIERDLLVVDQLYEIIGQTGDTAALDEEALIALAYRLHNLYNAFESIFQNIARSFENRLDDSAHWHAQLLQRMRLDVTPLRPAVIDDAAYDALDELRRFRHLFRYAYDVEIDRDRLQLVLSRANRLRVIYGPQMEAFLGFLRDLYSEAG